MKNHIEYDEHASHVIRSKKEKTALKVINESIFENKKISRITSVIQVIVIIIY